MHHARIEPLVGDLRKYLGENLETPDYFETYAHAMRLVLENGGKKVKPETKEAILELMMKMLDSSENQSRLCSAGVVAAVINHMDDSSEALEPILNISGTDEEMASKLVCLGVLVKLKCQSIIDNPVLLNCLVVGAKSDEPIILEGTVLSYQ